MLKTPLAPTADGAAHWGPSTRAPGASAPGFGAALSQAQSASSVVVQSGDNLTRLVKAQAQSQGVRLDESTAYRLALRVAQDNGIAKADQIAPGQTVDLSRVVQHLAEPSKVTQNSPSTAGATALTRTDTSGSGDSAVQAHAGSGEILERTLQRAVAKGYIAADQLETVRARVDALAQRFGFSGDDFALVSLMESDGLNPQASNGNCHGVIQFCAGPGRGAASVGLASRPRAILRLDVLQQLDLVERYFSDVGVNRGARLDELYLAVLTPAARAQRAPNAPLAIAGRQARSLYSAGGAITRNSLADGLLRNAAARLGLSTQALQALRRGEAAPQLAQVAQAG